MKKKHYKVSKNRLNEIESNFEKLGILPADYPPYEDPDAFSKNFKQCSILKEVPLITTDST